MALLEVKNLGISFGGLRAVDEFNVSIEKGELYGLIGPNGAGKTTVFNMLTGVYKPSKGVITLDGENITGKSTRDIHRAGIAAAGLDAQADFIGRRSAVLCDLDRTGKDSRCASVGRDTLRRAAADAADYFLDDLFFRFHVFIGLEVC